MLKYHLEPTDKNIIDCYLNDTLDRNKDLYKFIGILSNIEMNISISLDGKWGSGKTYHLITSIEMSG